MSNPTTVRSLKKRIHLKNSWSSWFSSYSTYNVWWGNHTSMTKIAWHFVKCNKQLLRGSVTAMTTMVPQHTTKLCESNLLVQRSSAMAGKCCQAQSTQWVHLPPGNGTTTFAQMKNEFQLKREHIVDAFNKCSNWEQVQTCHHVARQQVVATPKCLPNFVVL